MIDIHCHILPQLDDGPDSMEKSMEMLKLAQHDGITRMIATPHYYYGVYDNTIALVSERIGVLKQAMEEHKIHVEIYPGQEIFLNNGTIRNFEDGLIGGLNYSRYMLVELPMRYCPSNTFDLLYELRIRGIVVVIAHPERYEYIIKNVSAINDFIEEGCLFQINAASITGSFGKHVRKVAYTLIRHGIVDFIGSDAHGTGLRIPVLTEAYGKVQKIDAELHQRMINNTRNVIEDCKIVMEREKIKKKKSIFNLIK